MAFTLKPNEIFGSLFNMIISQQVFTDNIKSNLSSLVSLAKVDGGLNGDTKLYYGTDVLNSYEWKQDDPANMNVLELHRPVEPKVQSIVIDKFRQIPLTVDYYMSRRAWMSDGIFSSFTGIMLGWIDQTKRVYDACLYNTFIGTDKPAVAGKQTQKFKLPQVTGTGAEREASGRLRAELIGQKLADLFVELSIPSRDFTDWRMLRSYNTSDLKVIWNSDYVNEIRKVDLPTLFHKEGLIDKFEEHILPGVYFGTVNAGTHKASDVNSAGLRSLIEVDLNAAGPRNKSSYKPELHLFPGDLIPQVTQSEYVFAANTTYTPDKKVIAKIYTELPPYMSAFETGTDFFNARNLSENHYLTFSHNTLAHLSDKPCIVISEDAE